MDRDYFIIMVYCLVCEHYPVIIGETKIRGRGFAPALSDEEVITIEICGEYFGQYRDEDIYKPNVQLMGRNQAVQIKWGSAKLKIQENTNRMCQNLANQAVLVMP